MQHMSGLKIMAGHLTMSDQDDYLSEQNLGMAVILTGHVCSFQKIVRFISGKYKQFNHKISQRVVVTKWNADFAFFFKYGEKISVFENIRICVDRALMFF